MRRLSAIGIAVVIVTVAAAAMGAGLPPTAVAQRVTQAPPPTAANCVTIAAPQPGVGFTYEHVTSTGAGTRYTQYWERVTDTGSRVRIERPGETLIQSTVHRVVDDVTLIGRMTKARGTQVIESTEFRPGLVGDPIFRACAGQSWPIPSVRATFSGTPSGSAGTPAGRLTIVSIRQSVTVPAGTFDTVEYVRTSQSRDVYWKSTKHGVIVKHMATVAGHSVTETLVGIK